MQKLNDRSIFISNIDAGITEDYLYRKFKQFGEMQSLKIMKGKQDQDYDKTRAVIVYTHEDAALEARHQLHNKILIRNMIKVKPFLEPEQFNQEARIHVSNLPECSDDFELEELFRGYGKILCIDTKTDKRDKLLRYCSIIYECQDDAKQLLQANPEIKYHGNVLKIDKFLSSKERLEQDTSIYWRAFARPLKQNEITNQQIIAYEMAWQLVIKKNLSVAGYKIVNCLVKFDKQNMQPWATIKFDSVESQIEVLEECEKQKSHTGFKSCANEAIYLISQLDTIESEGFVIKRSDAIDFLEQFIGAYDDPFLGESDNFFFNKARGIQKVDDRLLIVQNIRPDIDEHQLNKYLSKFGKIIKLTLKKSTNPKFRTQKCFVQYQTQQDAENARVSINLRNQESDATRYLIFDGGNAYVNILLKQNVRKGFKNLKEKQKQFNRPQEQNYHNQSPKKAIVHPPPLPFYSHQQQYQYYPQQPYNYRPNYKRNYYENSQQQSRFNQGSTVSSIKQDKEVFMDYSAIQKNYQGFSKLSQTKQREILGQILTQQIKRDNMVKNEADIPKIIAMLIDPDQFEISEILNFLENQEELIDWVQEGVDLLLEEQMIDA